MLEIPGYNIQRLLAEGGMAKVYLAQQKSLDRPVAIKALNPGPIRDTEEMSRRFLLEGRIIASLTHHNIVRIHDFGTVDEYRYIVMELLPQGTLRVKMRQRLIPVRIALKLIQHVGSALHYAHQRKIVHRDVKPSNILFRVDSSPVLTDFGIAKMLGDAKELTQTGRVLGTPYYVSPEQVQGKEVDGRSDIYSLGVILYEMLTGERPYDSDTPMSVLFKHVDAPIPRLPAHLAPLQTLVDKLLAKDPNDRFKSAARMIKYIQSLKEAVPLHVLADREPPPKRMTSTSAEEDRTIIQRTPVRPASTPQAEEKTVVFSASSPPPKKGQAESDAKENTDTLDAPLVEPPDDEFRGMFVEDIVLEAPAWFDLEGEEDTVEVTDRIIPDRVVRPPKVTPSRSSGLLWGGLLLVLFCLGGVATYFFLHGSELPFNF